MSDEITQPTDFTKKPVKIQAMHLLISNAEYVAEWCDGDLNYVNDIPSINIHTLEGIMLASLGDWVVKGVKGEFYPVKEDIFHATYDRM